MLLSAIVAFLFWNLVPENLPYGDAIVRLSSFFVLELIWSKISQSLLDQPTGQDQAQWENENTGDSTLSVS